MKRKPAVPLDERIEKSVDRCRFLALPSRKFLISILLISIAIVAAYQAGSISAAPSSSQTATINKWAMEKQCSYMFWNASNTIYAQNCNTGAIDYSGTDAATVINDAIIALGVNGGWLVFKTGVYIIKSMITVPASTYSWRLTGEQVGFAGNFGVIFRAGANLPTALLRLVPTNFVTVEYIGIDGGWANIPQYTTAVGILSDTGFADVQIIACTVKGSTRGIEVRTQNAWIERNWIEYNNGYGLFLANSIYTSVLQNMFRGNGNYDIYLAGCQYCTIAFNQAKGQAGIGSSYFVNAADNPVIGTNFAFNNLQGLGTAAYRFRNSVSHTHIVGDILDGQSITPNFLVTTGTTYTYIDATVDQVSVSGITGAVFSESANTGRFMKINIGGFNPQAVFAITNSTDSPYTYTNTLGYPIFIIVVSGTLTALTVNGVAVSTIDGIQYYLAPNQTAVFTWTISNAFPTVDGIPT